MKTFHQKTEMFKQGDLVILIDSKGKKYLLKLKKGAVFEFHKGKVEHNDIINKKEGVIVFSSRGEKLICFRPLLWEYLLKIKRKTQIIYPKDIGQIIILADISPGDKVFECGTGSGSLTLELMKAVGERGKVVSLEKSEEFLKVARENIEKFIKGKRGFGKVILQQGDLEEGIKEKNFDKVILDLPEPWKFLDKIEKILKEGGVLVCWLPTVLQVFNLLESVEKKFQKTFYLIGVSETLQRNWQKRGRSLRPEDRMVAHTGFLVLLRKLFKKKSRDKNNENNYY